MWLIRLTLLFSIHKDILINATVADCFDSIGQQIAEIIKPYEIIFYVVKNEHSNALKKDAVIRQIAQGVPFALEDLKNLTISNKTRSIDPAETNTARYFQSLNVILYYRSHDASEKSELDDLRSFIRDISELWSANIAQPKCLLIMINRDSITKNYSTSLLKYSWRMNILDFSIIEIQLNSASIPDSCILKSYNPFYNVVITKSLGQEKQLKIFPDKLDNVNGYQLKLGVVSSNLFIKLTRNKEGDIVDISSKYFDGIRYVLTQMNFSIIFDELGTSDPSQYTHASRLKYDQLQNGDINLEAVPSLMPVPDSLRIPELDYGISCEETIAVVPDISRYDHLIIPWKFFMFIFIILTLYRITLLVLRIETEQLRILDLLRIFLGIPISVCPRKLLGIIVVIGFFISLIWSTNFYSKLVEFKVAKQKIDFDTFKSIDESGFEIFAHNISFSAAFGASNITDKNLKNIRDKIILTDFHGLVLCLERLVKQRDCICIMTEILAELLAKEKLTSEDLKKLKFAKPIFACEKWTTKFAKASVFIIRFRRNLKKFHESGISRASELQKTHEIQYSNDTKEGDNYNVNVSQVVICILVAGYVISFLVFVIERIV